jgi:hypothetical protein
VYGHTPTFITSYQPPSKIVSHGNTPAVIWNPRKEANPTTTWNPVALSSIKEEMIKWIDRMSKISAKNYIIAIFLMSHGTVCGTVQSENYSGSLHDKNLMKSIEMYSLIWESFSEQTVYMVLDYCFSGREATALSPSYFKTKTGDEGPKGKAGEKGPKAIIHCSAKKMSYSNRLLTAQSSLPRWSSLSSRGV